MQLRLHSGAALRPWKSPNSTTTTPVFVPELSRLLTTSHHLLRLSHYVSSARLRPAAAGGKGSSGDTPSSGPIEFSPILYRFADSPTAEPRPASAYNQPPPRPSTPTTYNSPTASTVSAPARDIAAQPNDSPAWQAMPIIPGHSSGTPSPISTPTPAFTPGTEESSSSHSLTESTGSSQPSTTFTSSSPTSSYSDFYRQSNTRYGTSTHSEPPAIPGTAPAGINATPEKGSSSGTIHVSGQDVAEALSRAQAALSQAESSLDGIEKLNSDVGLAPPTWWERLLPALKSVAGVSLLCIAMTASHACGLAVQLAGAFVGALGIAGWGYRKGSLDMSGALAAMFVGCGTLGCSLRFGATLIAFFLSSSKLTQYKEELKEGLDDHSKKGGQRTWVQVFCNGFLPTVLAIVYGVVVGCIDLPLGPAPTAELWRTKLATALMGGFLGYYACCCGDTWASEVGPLSSDTPRLITTLRPVRRGTNGGVTLLGLAASILGGMFMGTIFYLGGLLSPTLWIFPQLRDLASSQWRLIPLGLMAGLFGSVLDSLLGATVQYTGYDHVSGRITGKPGPNVARISGSSYLDNNAVNAVSATLTSALTALVAVHLFGF